MSALVFHIVLLSRRTSPDYPIFPFEFFDVFPVGSFRASQQCYDFIRVGFSSAFLCVKACSVFSLTFFLAAGSSSQAGDVFLVKARTLFMLRATDERKAAARACSLVFPSCSCFSNHAAIARLSFLANTRIFGFDNSPFRCHESGRLKGSMVDVLLTKKSA